MRFELDHIVHFVRSPEAAATAFLQLGLKAVAGGRHEMWGTYNTLCYFGLSYIEWIGVFDDRLLEQSAEQPYTLHATYKNKGYREGLTRVALRTTAIKDVAQYFQELGLEVYGPDVFSRTKPDGTVVSWQLLHIGSKQRELDYPFFIQWDEQDEERLYTLQSKNALNKGHISYVKFQIKNASEAATEWARLLQGEIQQQTDVSSVVRIGNIYFEFEQSTQEAGLSQIKISGTELEDSSQTVFGGNYLFKSR